jgi:hypothetical protein
MVAACTDSATTGALVGAEAGADTGRGSEAGYGSSGSGSGSGSSGSGSSGSGSSGSGSSGSGSSGSGSSSSGSGGAVDSGRQDATGGIDSGGGQPKEAGGDAASPDWVDISPSAVDYAQMSSQNFGFQTIVGAAADHPKTLYVGTCLQGVWKSTDGGDTWSATSAFDGNSGRNWSIAIDFTDSNVVYAMSGYGGIQGLWKTTDGGGNWQNIQGSITQNDLSHVTMDPLDHLHLLVSEHSGSFALWESTDGGATWRNLGAPWGAHNTFVFFLGQDDAGRPSSAYWIGFAEGNGLWRTTDAGNTWTQVSTTLSRSHAGAGLYRSKIGALYGGVNQAIGRSTDNGQTWEDLAMTGNLPTSPDAYAGIVGDGDRIYSMLSNTGASAAGPYHWYVTDESGDGRTWTQYNAQTFQNGPGVMLFDSVNRVVYSSQGKTGLFRLTLP